MGVMATTKMRVRTNHQRQRPLAFREIGWAPEAITMETLLMAEKMTLNVRQALF